MANRKPYDLRNILVAYNLFQTVFSAWIFYEVSNTFSLCFIFVEFKFLFCYLSHKIRANYFE